MIQIQLSKTVCRKFGFMSKLEQVKKIIEAAGGIAKTVDFTAAGIAKPVLTDLTEHGQLVRIRQGYYRLADHIDMPEAQYIASLLPEGIVCVESALFYYGYSDYAPREWALAVPRAITLTKLRIPDVQIKPYFIQRNAYELGRTTARFDGIDLPIYDRERTICDCFKYRSRLDREMFNKAVNAYVADDQKKLGNLSKYAKKLGLYSRVMELMEVLLNG